MLFAIRFLIREETDVYKRSSMAKAKQVPWALIFRRYWLRWLGIALVWFMYDFISYPFGIYSSTVSQRRVLANAGRRYDHRRR